MQTTGATSDYMSPSTNEATQPRCNVEGCPDGPGRASYMEGESWGIRAKLSSELIRQSRIMQSQLPKATVACFWAINREVVGTRQGNSRRNCVADHLIDARSQTGTAPDEQTEMRYPTRASEPVDRRLQVPPSPLHDPSVHTFHAEFCVGTR